MSFHDHEQFDHIRSDLASLLVSTTAQFARNAGLQPLAPASLRQMSAPLEVVSAELLMFGCDTWPDSARCPDPVISDDAAMAPAPLPRQVRNKVWLWTLLALVLSTTFTIAFSNLFGVPPPNFFFGFAVTTVALMFGSTYGVALAILVPLVTHFVVYQLNIDPPVALPTLAYHAAIALFHLCLAIFVPLMVLKAIKFRTNILGRPMGADPLKRALGLI